MSEYLAPVYFRRVDRADTGLGLVRTDRAVLYVLQQLRAVVVDLEARATKTLGENGHYRVGTVIREMFPVLRMGDDPAVAETVMAAYQKLSSRTLRADALATLRNLIDRLSTYQPEDGIDMEASSGLDELHNVSRTEPEHVSEDRLADEGTVFVIMPLSSELRDVWVGGIQRAAKDVGFTAIRVDMVNRSTNITDDIVAGIEKYRLAIVDVTGNNPNVMFELGYAIAKAKKNIIISQSADYLPFDIRNIRTIVYTNTWSGIEELRRRIQDFLREAAPPKLSRKDS